MDTGPLIEALYATGIGLAVGLEREHSEVAVGLDDGAIPGDRPPGTGKAPGSVVMGARTTALLGLTGWLLAYLGSEVPWLLPVGVASVVLLIGAQMVMGKEIGMTTEVAGLVVLLLGALVRHDRALAVGLALGTTMLLVSKPWMIGFVGKLRRIEITATLQLLLLVAIVLPLLPAEAQDPWGAIRPRKVGTFIVLIAGVQYVGYVLTRLMGPERGVGLTGLVGGLTSSTAVTVSMARAARGAPELVRPGQLATFLANLVMPIRVVVIAGALSVELGWRVGIALAAMVLTLLVAARVTWRARRSAPPAASDKPGQVKLRNPFELWSALSWGLVLCVVLVAATLAQRYFGAQGLLIAAAISGVTDVDAITLIAAEQARQGTTALDVAALAITIAVVANTIAKGIMAYAGGGRAFGRRVVLVFGIATALTIAAGLAVLLAA